MRHTELLMRPEANSARISSRLVLLLLHCTCCVDLAACGAPPTDTWIANFDWENATGDVTVDVDGDGYSSGWHLVAAGPSGQFATFPNDVFILIRNDDCSDPYPFNDGISLSCSYNPETNLLEDVYLAYQGVDDCNPTEYIVVESLEVSGRVEYDFSRRRIIWVFEDLKIDIMSPVPPPGDPVIRSITLNGEFRAEHIPSP